jgi:hypothetical protein
VFHRGNVCNMVAPVQVRAGCGAPEGNVRGVENRA